MSGEMVNRVAELLQRRLFEEPADDLFVVAQEAINALREPTTEILDYRPAMMTMADAKAMWQYMIDEAAKVP